MTTPNQWNYMQNNYYDVGVQDDCTVKVSVKSKTGCYMQTLVNSCKLLILLDTPKCSFTIIHVTCCCPSYHMICTTDHS